MAVATTAKSRNIPLPRRANPANPETSEIPLFPPVHLPPKKARINPAIIAMAAPGTLPLSILTLITELIQVTTATTRKATIRAFTDSNFGRISMIKSILKVI
jgi:hypothetical protein